MAFKNLQLRQAAPDDLADIMALERGGFAPAIQESHSVFAERIAVFPQAALLASDDYGLAGCFFAELWRPAVRYEQTSFQLGHSIRSMHDPADGTELYIASMTVASRCRGSGVGGWLFQSSLARLQALFPELESAVLLVHENWLPARAIYRKSGFAEVAVFEGFFETAEKAVANSGDAGIVMRRALR